VYSLSRPGFPTGFPPGFSHDSIRINEQWRVIFRWSDGAAEDVEIVDYQAVSASSNPCVTLLSVQLPSRSQQQDNALDTPGLT
jgi:hypothetical protein